MGPFFGLVALVAPAGAVAFGAVGLLMQELILRHVVQPTGALLTVALTSVIPSLVNGLFWASTVQGIRSAQTGDRRLFWTLVLGPGAYWALVLGFVMTSAMA
jgi:hypothetical protein